MSRNPFSSSSSSGHYNRTGTGQSQIIIQENSNQNPFARHQNSTQQCSPQKRQDMRLPMFGDVPNRNQTTRQSTQVQNNHFGNRVQPVVNQNPFQNSRSFDSRQSNGAQIMTNRQTEDIQQRRQHGFVGSQTNPFAGGFGGNSKFTGAPQLNPHGNNAGWKADVNAGNSTMSLRQTYQQQRREQQPLMNNPFSRPGGTAVIQSFTNNQQVACSVEKNIVCLKSVDTSAVIATSVKTDFDLDFEALASEGSASSSAVVSNTVADDAAEATAQQSAGPQHPPCPFRLIPERHNSSDSRPTVGSQSFRAGFVPNSAPPMIHGSRAFDVLCTLIVELRSGK
jgi:hypothetical protein